MFLDDNHDDANNTNVTTQVDRLKDTYIPNGKSRKVIGGRGSGIRDSFSRACLRQTGVGTHNKFRLSG
jgi:hypothetical protein